MSAATALPPEALLGADRQKHRILAVVEDRKPRDLGGRPEEVREGMSQANNRGKESPDRGSSQAMPRGCRELGLL